MVNFAALNNQQLKKITMKKLFAIVAVAAFVFAACGQKKAEEPVATEPVAEEQVVVEEPVDTTVAAPVAETPAAPVK